MVQLIFELVVASVILMHRAAAATLALPTCTKSCGNLTNIPFPFGIGPGCFLDEWYEIECRPRKGNVLVPFLKKLDAEVVTITLYDVGYSPSSFIEVMLPTIVNRDGQSCRTNADEENSRPKYGASVRLQGSPFFFSGFFNNLIAVGCGTTSMLENLETGEFAGCTAKCQGAEGDTKGSRSRYSNCSSGINCCLSSILPGPREISFKLWNEENMSSSCGYAFLFNMSRFDYDHIDLDAVRKLDKMPVVLDWGVVKGLSITDFNITSASNFRCDKMLYGYLDDERYQKSEGLVSCICVSGYEGNPYTRNGCKDIDECKTGQYKCLTGTCVNRPGYYDCVVNQKMRYLAIGLGAGFGFLVFILFSWWIYKVAKKRNERKLREKYFQRNGGLLLQQQLHSINNNLAKGKLFSSRELEVATAHFNVNRMLGQGGGGTVYKGILQNGEIVAIKKSRAIDEKQVDQFINEIMILSQLNHRNIVKLLGCCLETEIPLLVYEFISNGTLHDHVHKPDDENQIPWQMRLQIAIDVANALSYMHSAALVPIYHRDIKSSNILLDENYRAKIADFGISRLISLEQTHLTTLVQGTFGYLDPEYFQSSQYTDKSDVYSFGIVLVELLTRQKPISSLTERQGRSLLTYFVHSIEDNLLFEITDPYILNQVGIEEISEVGNLAYRCLDLDGSKRPTMKEVKIELEAMKRPEDLPINVTEELMEEGMKPFDVNSSPSFRETVDQSSDDELLPWNSTW